MARKEAKCTECGRRAYGQDLCTLCRSRIELKEKEEMSVEEIAQAIEKVSAAITKSRRFDDFAEDVTTLIAVHNIVTKDIADKAYECQHFYPAVMYKDASGELRSKLIESLNDAQCMEPGFVLEVLAHIGGEEVCKAFYKLEESPMPWSQNLYVPPSYYAQCGGWTFDSEGEDAGKVRRLVFDKCYSFQDSRFDKTQSSSVATVFKAADSTCEGCGCKHVHLLTLDGHHDSLRFLDIDGKFQLTACPNCITMVGEPVYYRYELDGSCECINSQLQDENFVSDSEYDTLVANHLQLSLKPRSPYWTFAEDTSAVGGYPNWIQDPDYAHCHECQKVMKYLATLDWYHVWGGGEGALFVQICTDCKIAAVVHQQT